MPLTGHKFLPEEEAGRDFQRELTDWLGSNYGLDPDILGLTALDEALQVRSRDTGMSDFGVYVEHWRQDERERAALLQRLLVGETWLFREWASFQCLEDWLRRHDAVKAEIMPLFEETYGKDQALKWFVYWRLFYLACSELFGYRGGEEWGVAHYRFVKAA